ncbi:plasminogen receptor (KT)-like [Clavelina lepadiformis]|uniref:plasminogen receptor (KT)-like n=1 Tax=Clavelina lepadiformis TaxID=159417 RepID=UPI0040413B4B
MGQIASSVSSGMKATMEENFKKQQDFQYSAFQLQLERQLVMQNEIRERQMSMGIGRAREIVKYYGTFYSLLVIGGTLGAIKTKRMTPLLPAVPLGFVFAYQLDAAYGTLLQRVRAEAENIMRDERDLIRLPNDMPTFEAVEAKRLAAKSK